MIFPIVGNGVEIIKKCPVCEAKFAVKFKVRDKRIYCGRKCYAATKAGNAFFGGDGAAAQAKAVKSRPSIAGERNPFFGKKHSNETRELLSAKAAERVATKRMNPYKQARCGVFNGVRYDSSYELKRLMDLDCMLRRSEIVSYRKNRRLAISYQFRGCAHKYVPDFIVEYTDGTIGLEEVKGHEREKDAARIAAGELYCQQQREAGVAAVFTTLRKKDLFSSDIAYRQFLRRNK